MDEKLKLWEKISKGEVIFPEDVLMCIGYKKFLDDFKDGDLRAFVLSSDAGLECRMNHLVEQVKKLSKDYVPFFFYACFFFPTHSPLLISELVDFCDCLQSLNSEYKDSQGMWDTVSLPIHALHAVVLISRRDAMHCVPSKTNIEKSLGKV